MYGLQVAVELLAACVGENPALKAFGEHESGEGFVRLVRIASVVTFDGEAEVMREVR